MEDDPFNHYGKHLKKYSRFFSVYSLLYMRHFKAHLVALLSFVAFLCIFFWGMNVSDILGHDYFQTFPRLLSGNWHFARQGLMPFLYTPQLCGGLPMYANPQDMFYSLPQFLSFRMDLWVATLWSFGITMVIGYIGWYRVGKDILRLPLSWSHVLALVIISNGFYFLHMLIGHVVYYTVPLIGWGLWLLFDRRLDTVKSLLLRAGAFSLLIAAMLYSGGFFMAVLLMGTVLVALPIELLLSQNLRQRSELLGKRLLVMGIFVVLLNLSKLIAVFSFMRFFPRQFPFERFPEGASTIGLILKSLWGIPQKEALYQSVNIPDWGAIHEYSTFTSPVVALGLLASVAILYKKRHVLCSHWQSTLVLFFYCVFVCLFLLQLTRGYGLLVTPLETAPFFSSWRIMLRFLYIPAIILSGIGVWAISHCMRKRSSKQNNLFALCAMIITLIAFVLAYTPLLHSDEFGFTVPYSQIRDMIESSDYLDLPTEKVESNPDVSDFHGIFHGSTATPCYESLYWGTGGIKMDPLFIGTVTGLYENQFNMFNPACLVYPKANNCQPGDRIALEDYDNLVAFQNGQKTTWKISGLQKMGNVVSILTLLFVIAFPVVCVVRKRRKSC